MLVAFIYALTKVSASVDGLQYFEGGLLQDFASYCCSKYFPRYK